MTHFRCKKPFVNRDENSHLKFFRSFSALNFHEKLNFSRLKQSAAGVEFSF